MTSPAVAGTSKENFNNNDSFIIEIPVELKPEFNGTENIIHRVPRKLRKLNEAAYTPHLISIGPLHHNKGELRAMNCHKRRYKAQFELRNKSHVDLKDVIKEICGKVQKSYAGTMKFDGDWEDMILIDACFIIELFLRNDDEKTKKEDYILRTPWLLKAIQLDLILLENQLPYFLLQELYQTTKEEECGCKNEKKKCDCENTKKCPTAKNEFLSLAQGFFRDFCTRCRKIDEEILEEIRGSETKMEKIKHFTDLVRHFRLPSPISPKESTEAHLYSATELDKAGVRFVVNDKARLVDVKLSHKCYYFLQLELPALELDDATELLFRNMIALEQCLYSDEAYICNYITLMSQLINKDEDSDFLVEKKIIKNLSSQGVANLFAKLCNGISFRHFYYSQECVDPKTYHDKWLNRTLAKAKKVYFTDLWKTSSTVVGFFVLFFSISGSLKNIFPGMFPH